ncbi:MAG TPA: cytochrome c oxidase subunit 4 [Thermoleophilaceae bacterium]|jgi:Cytochrome c oxidase subunit IV|nr:cytochrome c oxidase subunit 4 [Thermoleophilaceae bacterium]
MAGDQRPAGNGAEPPGELIHLPGPSYLPVLLALGIALAVVGVVISIFLVVAGVAISVVVLARWIRETRRDIAELPLEHH